MNGLRIWTSVLLLFGYTCVLETTLDCGLILQIE